MPCVPPVASIQNLTKIYRKPGANVEVAALRNQPGICAR